MTDKNALLSGRVEFLGLRFFGMTGKECNTISVLYILVAVKSKVAVNQRC
ncbi:MAG: hypothetical protein ACOX42_02130 [Clostridia bacterium]